MFCSGCGTELEAGLNYCKRCGNRVGGGERSAVAENLSSALGYIGGFGLLGLIAVLYVVLRSPIIPAGAILLIALLYLATLFGICFLILKQTAPFALGKANRNSSPDDTSAAPAYLAPVTTAQLREGSDEPASITDRTTKTLDQVPLKRG